MEPKLAQMREALEGAQIDGVVIKPLQKLHDSRGWLAEIFRHDELAVEFYPAMAYISSTLPGVTRGPHEHVNQADLFCFIGPSNFLLRMWDNRATSETYGATMTVEVGEGHPSFVLIPSGVVHAYKNIGSVEGIVINCPNRLYMGEGRNESVDEIRYEKDSNNAFGLD